MNPSRTKIWSGLAALACSLGLTASARAQADPTVTLGVVDASGAARALSAGEARWLIGYDNVGDTSASGVIVRVSIPAGLSFLVGSVVNVDPAVARVDYSNDGGASWTYVPAALPGTPDPSVTDLRLVALVPLPAAPISAFSATTASDFALGSHAGTWHLPGLGVLADPATGAGTYTSRAFPFPGEPAPSTWQRLRVADSLPAGGLTDIRYDILDGLSGEALPGLTGLRPVAGQIDLAGVSSSAHPSLKVRAQITSPSTECFRELTDQTDPDSICAPDPLGLNDAGVVFGNLWRTGGCKERGFVWNSASGMTVLRSLELDRYHAYAYDMNAAGVVVGESAVGQAATTHAVLWPAGSATPTDLHTFGADTSSWATDISDNGTVAGVAQGLVSGPWRWTAGGGLVGPPTGAPANAEWDFRARVNDAGVVAGRYRPFGSKTWRAYRWEGDTFVDLDAPGDVAAVTGLNASGWVTGYGAVVRDGWVARPGLPTLALADAAGASGRFFAASGVTNDGVVYGSYLDAADHRRPFRWTAAAGVTSLATLGWAQGEVVAANGNGDLLVAIFDGARTTGPYARLAVASGTSVTALAAPDRLLEVWATKESPRGFHPFNNTRQVTGYYVPADVYVGGEPAEVPYFSGDCSAGAASLSALEATWQGPGGGSFSLLTTYEASSCPAGPDATATITGTPDADPGNNVARRRFAYGADVGVALTASPGVGSNGDTITWTATATNFGLTEATDVTMTLSLPSAFSPSGPRLLLAGATLAVGESRAVTVVTAIADLQPGALADATVAVTATTDCFADNDNASGRVVEGQGPNLYARATSSTPLFAGGALTGRIDFGNNGTQAFVGPARLLVRLPPGVALVSAVGDRDPSVAPGSPAETVATFTLGEGESVEPGQSFSLQLTATTGPCLPSDGLVETVAVWDGDLTADLNPSDNEGRAPTVLVGETIDDGDACTTDTCHPDGSVTHEPLVCPASELCADTVSCDPTSGCRYATTPEADDGAFCTINERCEGGVFTVDVRSCTRTCELALDAQCDLSSDTCMDIYDPAAPDTDFDGVPDQCDACASDYFNCTGDASAVYAVVRDTQGRPAGSVRCRRDHDTGALGCMTRLDPISGLPTAELTVFPELTCGP